MTEIRSCGRCGTRVLPTTAGTCPSCGAPFTQATPLKCPECGLFSPPTSSRCDCGHDFSGQQTRNPHKLSGFLQKPFNVFVLLAVFLSGFILFYAANLEILSNPRNVTAMMRQMKAPRSGVGRWISSSGVKEVRAEGNEFIEYELNFVNETRRQELFATVGIFWVGFAVWRVIVTGRRRRLGQR